MGTDPSQAHRRRSRHTTGPTTPRWLLIGLAVALIATACSVGAIDDPGLGDVAITTRVLAADGSLIAEWHDGENRLPVAYDDLPGHLVDAVVAIEDSRYWKHPGVDLAATARALAANIEAGEIVQGGSTITQQYVKNVLLSPQVDLERKAEEAILALALEQSLTKQEILERYLNTVYFGAGAYGVGAAANRFFGVDVTDLDLAQSALLAGAIRAPSTTNPITDPAAALERRNRVLDAMLVEGMITESAHSAATSTPLALDVTEPVNRHPYFTEEVRRRLLADDRLGATVKERAALLSRGGLTIETTLDPVHQKAAEQAVDDVMAGHAPAAAFVAIEPATGRVLALVGGRDFWSGAPGSQFNLATQGRRQPGSTMKPFVLAAALERGWTLDSVLTGAARTTIPTATGPWRVENYEAMAFPDLTLADATAYSVNTAYATLIDAVGADAVADVALRTGVGLLDAVPTLALGTEEVSLLDLTSGYATFANAGTRMTPHLVSRVIKPDGTVLIDVQPSAQPALDAAVANDVTATLTGVVSRGTGALARIGRVSAGKTGTTQDSTDAWFVGFTPEVAAGVWIGFPTSTRPLTYPATPYTITGGSWPALIWSRYGVRALVGVPYSDMPRLDGAGLVSVRIDPSTGAVLGDCPAASAVALSLGADPGAPQACDATPRMPQTVGLQAAEAATLIANLGLPYSVEWREDVAVAAGTVVGHTPAAGTAVEDIERIVIQVAGAEPAMPSVLGRDVGEGRDLLRGLPSLLTVVVELSSTDLASGTVWKQSPPAGTSPPATITLWVEP